MITDEEDGGRIALSIIEGCEKYAIRACIGAGIILVVTLCFLHPHEAKGLLIRLLEGLPRG
jgi:hypothetical protein